MAELSPIEEYSGVLLKRDDKYIYGFVNGGKLRQAEHLILNNLNTIRTKHNNTIVTNVSIKSPQSAIISSVCKKHNISCIILTYKTDKPNINLSIAQKEQAQIYGFKSGYSSVLKSYCLKLFPIAFYINMGFEDGRVIESIEEQVQNLPQDLDVLVVPVGSAMNFIGILNGLERYNLMPKSIYGVWVGKNPTKTIEKYYKGRLKFSLIKYPKPYGTEINIDNYFFDMIYEAKAYDWLIKNIDISKNKCLLWVVGRRNTNKELIEKINFVDTEEILQKKLGEF